MGHCPAINLFPSELNENINNLNESLVELKDSWIKLKFSPQFAVDPSDADLVGSMSLMEEYYMTFDKIISCVFLYVELDFLSSYRTSFISP